MSVEDFRKIGHEIIDWLCDYSKNVEKLSVRSKVKPGEIKKGLAESPPENGESLEKIFGDFQKVIMPGITHWQHPSFFAYFPANTSYPSMLAEFLSAGLGVNAMLWETSPAATELETRVMDWLKDMLKLPKEFKGAIQDTASTSTLCALICARERVTGFKVNDNGFSGLKYLRIYASVEAHSSVEKGAKIAGFGKRNVVAIPSDEQYSMIPDALEEAIKGDLKKGLTPCCVVGTVGTTSSTSIDPLPEIGEICSKYKVWFHVDGAHAGSAAILPEKRSILDGIEYADSFVFNPHKWLFTNFDCSAFFVKDEEVLRRSFEIHPEYLKTRSDPDVINYRDWGIQLGRRFRALKLWFVIRNYGVKGLQDVLRNHIKWANDFAGWVDKSSHFERLAPVTVNLVCFRLNPSKGKGTLNEAELEKMNMELLDEINDSGRLYLTHTKLKGKYSLRLCVGQTNVQKRHVEEAWKVINTSKTIKKYI